MSRRKEPKLDPEEILRRKFRAKCRFRACIRLVMANTYWLSEDVDQYEGDDVKKRVEQAVRAKGKKQLLSIKDKGLLNKPATDRTDSEKKYINRIIGGLACFKRYPHHVKRKLAAVTYFKYYGPGRTIIREGQMAQGMYFVVSGNLKIFRKEFDEILQKDVQIFTRSLQTGDVFGEVSLIHDVPRTATVTTIDNCELLMLTAYDFKNVLFVSVQKQWEEIRVAMANFSYFDTLDERAMREGCMVAKIKNYHSNEILLGDGLGIQNHVYFILKGKCQMIETMNVIVKKSLHKSFYYLHDPYVPKEQSEEDFQAKWMKNLAKKSEHSDHKEAKASGSSIHTHGEKKVGRTSILKHPSEHKLSHSKEEHDEKKASFVEVPEQNIQEKNVPVENVPGQVDRKENDQQESLPDFMELAAKSQPRYDDSHEIMRPSTSSDRRVSKRLSVSRVPEQVHFRTYYMQVCQYNPGASFGFGENMRDRRIVALTNMECLLMPHVWLLERNTANIWTRIKYYLEKKIPQKAQLFEKFLEERRWEEFKIDLVEEVCKNSVTVNSTSVHDVPYSVRLEEMYDV